MINTEAYSFVSQAYTEDVEKMIALIETTVGAGTMFGPMLGSFVYSAVGFEWTFYIFGIVMAPISFLVLFTLPKPTTIKDQLKQATEEADLPRDNTVKQISINEADLKEHDLITLEEG